MSTYAQIQGELIFDSKEKLAKATDMLTKAGYIKKGRWINELGAESDEFVSSDLRIEIPRNEYRNLRHFLDELVKLSSNWDIVWASNDGMFSGGVISSAGNKSSDLSEWAKDQDMDYSDRKFREDEIEEMYVFQQGVIDAYVEDYGE